jgi:hypothetical protein
MKATRVLIILAVVFLCTTSAFSRGRSAPPPRYVGLGSSGDWTGSGPLTGFDTPLGEDWPGNGDGNGGTIGFGWNPTGSSQNPSNPGSPPSGTCGSCPCLAINYEKYERGESNFCDNYCQCVAEDSNIVGPYKGHCYTNSHRSGRGGSCCYPLDDPCYQ